MADPENAGAEVANKVMRRLEVSKMTRALQNRLALANVKIKHGWENLSIDTIEPQIDQQLKRKRPASSINDSYSDTSSSVSSRFYSVNGLASSPLTAPIFSDDVHQIGSTHGSTRSSKRLRFADVSRYPASSSQTGRKTRSAAAVQSWKKTHSLPESSPAYHTRHAMFPPSARVPKLSFISEGDTVADEPRSPELSEEDDTDLPVHSFAVDAGSFSIQSSPPRTPRTQPRLFDKAAGMPWSRTPRDGDGGADLLMYLATSPTPAHFATSKRTIPPSTPPTRTTPLPSSMMNTPGGTNGLFGFGLSTPSNNFNFSDFCNVTPSPAQAHWAATKSPATAREPRRKLNFDGHLQLSSSPDFSRDSAKDKGKSLELGGAL